MTFGYNLTFSDVVSECLQARKTLNFAKRNKNEKVSFSTKKKCFVMSHNL